MPTNVAQYGNYAALDLGRYDGMYGSVELRTVSNYPYSAKTQYHIVGLHHNKTEAVFAAKSYSLNANVLVESYGYSKTWHDL